MAGCKARVPLQVYPEKGTVSFSAGLHGWAFTLTSFAKIYASKFGVEVPPSTWPAAPCLQYLQSLACPGLMHSQAMQAGLAPLLRWFTSRFLLARRHAGRLTDDVPA